MTPEEIRFKIESATSYWERTPLMFPSTMPASFQSWNSLSWSRDEPSMIPIDEVNQHKLGWLILKILETSKIRPSAFLFQGPDAQSKYSFHTSSGRWRTAWDIWSHVIYFKPNVTLPRVMRYLYSNRDKLAGQVCSQIHRRTFKLKSQTSFATMVRLGQIDEFGLQFEDWKFAGERGSK